MDQELRNQVFQEIERELGFGMVPNVFLAMGPHPKVLEANWRMFSNVVLHGELPRVIKEMVGVVVSATHGSPYARDVHLHSLEMQGVTNEVLAALGKGELEAPGLPDRTVKVLRFARAVAAGEANAMAELLENADLSEAEVLEIVATVQVFSAVNVFTDTLGVEVDSV